MAHHCDAFNFVLPHVFFYETSAERLRGRTYRPFLKDPYANKNPAEISGI